MNVILICYSSCRVWKGFITYPYIMITLAISNSKWCYFHNKRTECSDQLVCRRPSPTALRVYSRQFHRYCLQELL